LVWSQPFAGRLLRAGRRDRDRREGKPGTGARVIAILNSNISTSGRERRRLETHRHLAGGQERKR